jgi:hypothetical protein
MWNFDYIRALNFLITNGDIVKELNNRELGPACKSSARLKMGGDTSHAQRCRNMHWGHGGAWLARMKGA